jgi:hypothetical protein
MPKIGKYSVKAEGALYLAKAKWKTVVSINFGN